MTESVDGGQKCGHSYRMMRSGGRKVMRCILCGRQRPVQAPFDPMKGIR